MEDPQYPPMDNRALVVKYAQEYGIDPGLALSLVKAESSFNPKARSPKGAMGVMQIMPGTWKSLQNQVHGLTDPWNAEQNIKAGMHYLSQQIKEFGPRLGLAAYNAGPGAVRKYGGVPPYAETQAYVKKITGDASGSAQYAPRMRQVGSPIVPSASGSVETPSVLNNAINLFGPSEAAAAEIPMTTSWINPYEVQEPAQQNWINPYEQQSNAPRNFDEAAQIEAGRAMDAGLLEDRRPSYLKNPIQTQIVESMSPLDRALVGVGHGMMEKARGVQQLGSEIKDATGFPSVIPDDTTRTARITQEGVEAREQFRPLEEYSPMAQGGALVGRTLPEMMIPGGGARNPLLRAGTAGLAGAGIGLSTFVGPGEDRILNAVIGGGGAAGTSLGLAGLSKAYNAYQGPPETRLGGLSKQFKVPLTLSEETSGLSSRGEVMLERAWGPLGIKSFRVRQMNAAKTAASEFFSKYVADPTLDTTAEMKVVNDALLDTVYNRVRTNAPRIPRMEAPATKTQVVQMLDDFPDVFKSVQNNRVKGILANIHGDIKDYTINTGILNQHGNPITRTETPDFSFDDIWELRKGIGREIEYLQKATSRTSKDEVALGQFKRIYGAVSDDIDNMLSHGPPRALRDFKTANDAFKQYSVKFDVLRQAYDKARGVTGPNPAGEGGFRVQQFSTALKKLANDPNYKGNVKWLPGEIEEMTGLASVLEAAKRSSQHLENPPTGQRYGAISVLGGIEGASYAVGGHAAALSSAAKLAMVSLLGRFITTTPAGKRIAMAASKIEPSSRAMDTVMGQIYRQLPKFAAEAGLMGARDDTVTLPQTGTGE